jgi:hypothetical protein
LEHIEILNQQNEFSHREVGLTHPDKKSFIKLADNGDIHIMAENRVGIIISASQECIFLVADTVKFLTKEEEGLKWNKVAFNSKATSFHEPTFVYPKKDNNNIYNGISQFLE